MKKFLAGMLVLFVLAVTVPTSVSAQKCYKPRRQRSYATYNNEGYGNYTRYESYRKRSFYQKHKDKINVGAGGVGGALIGGILGGKKGAVVGALLGGGGAALYTYKIRKNRNR
jgi:hypothetical protein